MFASLFKSERRAIQATAWGAWAGDHASPAWAGAEVGTSSALQLLTVYGCNRFICDGIATLPVDTLSRSKDIVVHTPKPGWLEEPLVDVDPVAWFTQILTSLLLAGNSYLFLDYQNTLSSLVPLDPSKVSVRRVQGRKVFDVLGEQFDSRRILHIPGVMFPGAEIGMSPVEAARQTIGAGLAVTEFAARFFGQGLVTSGVIEVPGDLPPDRAKEMAQAYARLHSGKSKAHLPAVLQGGATWKSTSVTNEQAQFLETRGFTSSEIAGQMFIIDPTELGLPALPGSNLTYANLEQRNARKVQVTFLPWLVRLEKAMTALMAPGQYMKFNVNGLLRGDTKTRYETYQMAVTSRIASVNEERALEDMPPIAGGDVSNGAVEALGQLIRMGFEPADSLKILGLPPIKHTGVLPVTVQPEDNGMPPVGGSQ